MHAGVLDIVRTARGTGVLAVLDGHPAVGGLVASGPDAARFLHSQVTNDVEGLEAGQGNHSARVTRTGHLVEVFSLHRLPDTPDRFLALLDRDGAERLRDALDAFLFADRVELEVVTDGFVWVLLQGPVAGAVVADVFGVEGLAEHGVVAVEGGWLIRRSLTGDDGFVLALDRGDGDVLPRLRAAAAGRSVIEVTPEALAPALDIARIEAGIVRVGPDTAGRVPLLPETGLEQSTVSYTKGCYLGQEVIARVRTYGSVPFALRVLVLEGEPAVLDRLPPAGDNLLGVDGARLGVAASRAWSPEVEAPVVFAYLGRNFRTPGTTLEVAVQGGSLAATVTLLPLFRAADQDSRVAHLYDRAIRVFAQGKRREALALLEGALRLDPSFADAYEVIGVMLGREGLYHEAIDFFRRLEEVAPDEPMVNTNLSLYYMKLGDRATAESQSARALQKAMTRGRAATDGRPAAEVAREQQEARRADARRKREMFGRVLAFDPVDPIALSGLGRALATLGELDEAASYLARASEVDRNNSAVYLEHGKALEALDRRDEAVAVYREGMEVASRRGDLMPLKEMEHRVLLLGIDPDAPVSS